MLRRAVVPGDRGRPRPGIIVQSDELGDRTTTLLARPLSSDVLAGFNPRLRPLIEPDVQNGVRARSQIMTDKLFAQRRERIRGVIGTIDPETRVRLDSALPIVLGLTSQRA